MTYGAAKLVPTRVGVFSFRNQTESRRTVAW